MLRKILAFVLASVFAVVLCGCSSANEYGLAYTPDGSGSVDYIYYNEDRVVYVVGGLVMADADGEAKLLEMALDAGEITIDEIIEAADSDAEDGDIEKTVYPDGSCEYHYEGFNIIVLNTHLRNIDVYFTPSEMGYFDIINK